MTPTPFLELDWLPGRYAVCRLDARAEIPDWARTPASAIGSGSSMATSAGPGSTTEGSAHRSVDVSRWTTAPGSRAPGARGPAPHLLAHIRTANELSIITLEALVPRDVHAERGFVALAMRGPLDFALVGVLARLTGALADARIPVFVLSTFDTDLLLVRADRAGDAHRAITSIARIYGSPPE